MDIKKMENESKFEYIKRLTLAKRDKTADLDYSEWSQLCFDKEYSTDVARRMFYGIEKLIDAIGNDNVINITDEEKFKQLEAKKREVYIETQKYRDITNEYHQLQREQSRCESMDKIIEDAFIKREKYVPMKFINQNKQLGNVEVVACLADAHLGAVFCIKGFKGEVLNEYNPEVFKQRLNELHDEIISFCKMNNTNKIRMVDLGDSIEGVLHLSQLRAMKSDIVDDIIDYADLIVDFVNSLTSKENGLIIDMYTSTGNHSDLRLLTGKKGDFPHENLEKIYFKWLKKCTQNNPNMTLHDNLNGLNYFNVNGYNFLSSHGQNEKSIKNSIGEYEDMYNIKIDYFLVGHLHSKNEFEASKGKEVIQVRSMMGINEFSQIIKKTSHAGANMFTVHEKYGKKYVNEVKFLN